MSGPGEGKIKLGKADVYLHVKGKSKAQVTHIDVELSKLNKIIKPGENSYVGGKNGGIFLGLRKNMIQRIENSLSHSTSRKLKVKRAESLAKRK